MADLATAIQQFLANPSIGTAPPSRLDPLTSRPGPMPAGYFGYTSPEDWRARVGTEPPDAAYIAWGLPVPAPTLFTPVYQAAVTPVQVDTTLYVPQVKAPTPTVDPGPTVRTLRRLDWCFINGRLSTPSYYAGSTKPQPKSCGNPYPTLEQMGLADVPMSLITAPQSLVAVPEPKLAELITLYTPPPAPAAPVPVEVIPITSTPAEAPVFDDIFGGSLFETSDFSVAPSFDLGEAVNNVALVDEAGELTELFPTDLGGM